ncbi:MAG TPA: serine/threonine-protein kinase [Myxococcales bacterium]
MAVGSTYGKFFLLKKLAAGGMGEIFLARQQGPAGFEKVVVIKRILNHLTDSPEYLESFLQEARLQARMNHSAVVQIFDLGQAEEDGSFYLAMEYIHGKSLHELIGRLKARRETLPAALASTIIERVAEGLSYAHNLADNAGNCLNIIHRDISPHNVLVSYQGDVKLIDFGIAKSEINTNKTEAGTIKGKFFYMSPEQSAAKKIDKRSDLFSLGIVAYEALTGDNPFWRPNVVNALEAIQKQDPPPLSFERPELAAFERIIGKALAKDPDDRYEDASDFKDALTAARVSLGPPAEKLGPLLQRIFKDKVEQENRILVDTDSASLPLKQQSSSKIRLDTGKKVASAPKPRPQAAPSEDDDDARLQREPTPVVELPPRKLIESAQTQLSAPAKKAPASQPEESEDEGDEDQSSEDPSDEGGASEEEIGETLIRDPLPRKTPAPVKTPAAAKSPAPAKAPRPEPKQQEEEAEQRERPTLSMDAKAAAEEDAAAVAKMKSGKGPLFLGIGVAALVAVGIGYVALSGKDAQPKQIDLAQPLKPDLAPPLNPPPAEDDPAKAAEAKKAEEAKAAEDAKRAEEAKKAEQAKTAEDSKKAAEEAKKAEEAKAAGDAKAAAEAKKAEAAKTAADAKAAAEAKKAEEAKAAADAKAAAQAKKAEEAKAAAEAKKAADAKKAEESKAAAEAKKAADAKKAEETKTTKVATAPATLGTLSIRMASAVLKLNGKAVDGAQVMLPGAKGTLDVVADGLPLKVSVTYSAGGAQILTDPWAIAYVNGVSKGKTPLAVPWDAEPRRIEFKRPGLDQPVTLMWKFSK